MDHPRPGKHYPRSVGEFQAWFRTDADCLDYLEWVRWPAGFVCPACGEGEGWPLADARFKCSGCGARTSVTAGTIFDRTRTPLTVWFTACGLFASGKDGISALSLKRTLEIGSYQTAWAMLHRLRSVLVRPGRELLTGTVEVDKTYIGGREPGLRGGRAKGKKVLTGIAVEIKEPKGYGRCRMAPLVDASGASLHTFVSDHVEPGATVITDGWEGYCGLENLGYGHEPRSQRAARASAQLPERVRVPLQPTPLPKPRNGVLPGARTRSRPRPGPLRRHHCRSPAPGGPPNAAENPRQAAEPRSTSSEAPVAGSVRLDGDSVDRLSDFRRDIRTNDGAGSKSGLFVLCSHESPDEEQRRERHEGWRVILARVARRRGGDCTGTGDCHGPLLW